MMRRGSIFRRPNRAPIPCTSLRLGKLLSNPSLSHWMLSLRSRRGEREQRREQREDREDRGESGERSDNYKANQQKKRPTKGRPSPAAAAAAAPVAPAAGRGGGVEGGGEGGGVGWVTGEPAAPSCCLGEHSVPAVSPVLRAKCNREVTPSWGHPRAPVGLTAGVRD